jgi:hypothetical protein
MRLIGHAVRMGENIKSYSTLISKLKDRERELSRSGCRWKDTELEAVK